MPRTVLTLSFALSAAGAAALLAAGTATAQDTNRLLLSYEAIPSVQVELDLEGASYAEREAFTQTVHDRLLPAIFTAVGVDGWTGADLVTDVTPGGYLLNTNASLQTELTATDAQANRLSAAVGYVFRQWSVLVTDFADTEGGTGYAIVAFPEGSLTGEAAHAFFEHAAAVDEGLGGGYTAFGDEMIFLNVTDGEGNPYSGLADADFIAGLTEAAASFAPLDAAVTETGEAAARFVGNDWSEAVAGDDYAAVIDDPDLMTALDALVADHTALVMEAVAAYDW